MVSRTSLIANGLPTRVSTRSTSAGSVVRFPSTSMVTSRIDWAMYLAAGGSCPRAAAGTSNSALNAIVEPKRIRSCGEP